MARLPTERWRDLPVAMPPEDEQLTIVRFLNEATHMIVTAITRTDREIALLREYRTRLIADVVTGKLDVREAAAQLPDQVEEPQPLDDAEADNDIDADAAAEELDSIPEEAEV